MFHIDFFVSGRILLWMEFICIGWNTEQMLLQDRYALERKTWFIQGGEGSNYLEGIQRISIYSLIFMNIFLEVSNLCHTKVSKIVAILPNFLNIVFSGLQKHVDLPDPRNSIINFEIKGKFD